MPLAPLVERGFAVASLDFSPASKARFPGQVHEIKAAIRFLRAEAQRYGYDASRIAHHRAHPRALISRPSSARATATPSSRARSATTASESSDVQAIVSYFAATNLTTILAQSTPFGLGIREPALKRLLGAAPKDAEALAQLASPVFQVDRSDPPLMLFHGDQDPQMPINQSHELEGAYEQQGLRGRFHRRARRGARRRRVLLAENVERVVTFLGAQLGAAAAQRPRVTPAATRSGPHLARALGNVLGRPAAPTLAMHFFGLALHVGVTTAEEQAARRADARTDQAEIGRGIEQARIPRLQPGKSRST